MGRTAGRRAFASTSSDDRRATEASILFCRAQNPWSAPPGGPFYCMQPDERGVNASETRLGPLARGVGPSGPYPTPAFQTERVTTEFFFLPEERSNHVSKIGFVVGLPTHILDLLGPGCLPTGVVSRALRIRTDPSPSSNLVPLASQEVPNLFAALARARIASTSRLRGSALVTSESSGFRAAAAISSTARLNAASLALEGLEKPVSFFTN